MRRGLLCMVLVLFVACSSDTAVPCPWQAPPTLLLDLRVTLDRTEVGLLQPVMVTVDRYRQNDVEVSFAPIVPDTQFVTQDSKVSEERSYGDGWWQRTTIILLPIDGPGDLKIPPFSAETVVPAGEVAQVATTPEQVLTVTTTLAAEHGAEIEAPGDPFPTPAGYLWYLIALAAVLLIAGIVWWRRSRQQNRSQAVTVAVPAHIKAIRQLLRWKDAPRTTPAEIDAFYVGVSHVLRVYLEDRFGLHAPERTTEEFLHDLDGSIQLVRDHGLELRRFLSQCDLVKFARLVPTDADHQMTYEMAESFVESTRADRAVVAPVAAPSTEGHA
ncbi:MAG: hypothetical protein ACI8UD_003939 [Planctomycetota bacterium]|jgi:hypothetical protein